MAMQFIIQQPEAPLPEKATRERWERKQRYHQAASVRRAQRHGLYLINRNQERAEWDGHFGGDAA